MKKRIVVDIDKELWRQASICAAKMQTTKKHFLENALRKYLEEAGEKNGNKSL